ncbi:MAG: DUF3592 domain-containing protein [Vicinamibacterales bacterium]
MRHVVRVSLLVLLALGGAVPVALAGPDFTKTIIAIEPSAPREADLVTFVVTLRNTGPDDAGAVYVTLDWPLMGFFVDGSGIDGAEIDHDARRITLSQVPLPAGGERRLAIRVLAPRDSGGDALSVALRMSHFDSGTDHYDRASVTVDTRLAEPGVPIAGVRVTRAGIVVLVVLAAGVLLWLTLRGMAGGSSAAASVGGAFTSMLASRIGPGSAAAAITIAVGFWVLFASMAWRDYQSLSWPATTCTILGGRLSAQSTTRSSSSPATGTQRDDTNYVPVLGLRYMVDGRETYSSGYDTGSRLGIGGRGGRAEELARWAVGATTPCWYAPADPLDVVVQRGFGGAYLFALLPVPVFWLGLIGARAAVSRTPRRR